MINFYLQEKKQNESDALAGENTTFSYRLKHQNNQSGGKNNRPAEGFCLIKRVVVWFLTASGADGDKDVSADQVSSHHVTPRPCVHAIKGTK